MRTSKNPTHVFFKKVKSSSNKNKEYTVRQLVWSENDIEWKCSCPHHVMRNQECKHIKEVRSQNARRSN